MIIEKEAQIKVLQDLEERIRNDEAEITDMKLDYKEGAIDRAFITIKNYPRSKKDVKETQAAE